MWEEAAKFPILVEGGAPSTKNSQYAYCAGQPKLVRRAAENPTVSIGKECCAIFRGTDFSFLCQFVQASLVSRDWRMVL